MRPIDADEIGLTDFEILECRGSYKTALEMILKKIEKAPTVTPQEPILDKIRAEIQDVYVGYRHGYEIMSDILAIIDKYKAESEKS